MAKKTEDKTNAEEIAEIEKQQQDQLLSDTPKLTDDKDEKPADDAKPDDADKGEGDEVKETPEEKAAREKEEAEAEEQRKLDEKEALKEEIRKEISQEQADKIIEAITGKKTDATEDEKSRFTVAAEKFRAEHGRNPTWHELTPFIAEEVRAQIKQEQEAEAEEAKKEAELEKKTKEERQKIFETQLDEELEELYSSNKLPKIVDKDDPKDYGKQVREALFAKMIEVNGKRAEEGKTPISSVSRIYNNYFTVPKRGAAGADAPISAGRGGAASNDSTELDYDKHIRGARSMLDIMMGR